MHVHVISADGEAVIEIGRKARLIRAGGMKDKGHTRSPCHRAGPR
ncbi:hypothetical protein [Acetobacter ghanensis]|nr:hypothetical protein [Acetobacter ghanensis]